MGGDWQVYVREERPRSAAGSALVFGLTDGATLILGLLLGMVVSGQSGSAMWHAALGGGLAELGGMSLGQYWSDPAKDKRAAFASGAGACLAPVLAGLPFALGPRALATVCSLVVIAATALLICSLRAETGWRAVARTFGMLAVVGLLAGGSALL